MILDPGWGKAGLAAGGEGWLELAASCWGLASASCWRLAGTICSAFSGAALAEPKKHCSDWLGGAGSKLAFFTRESCSGWLAAGLLADAKLSCLTTGGCPKAQLSLMLRCGWYKGPYHHVRPSWGMQLLLSKDSSSPCSLSPQRHLIREPNDQIGPCWDELSWCWACCSQLVTAEMHMLLATVCGQTLAKSA